VLIDSLAFLLELLRRKTHCAQDSEAAGLAHSDHDIAAVGKGKDWNIDSKALADFSTHFEEVSSD